MILEITKFHTFLSEFTFEKQKHLTSVLPTRVSSWPYWTPPMGTYNGVQQIALAQLQAKYYTQLATNNRDRETRVLLSVLCHKSLISENNSTEAIFLVTGVCLLYSCLKKMNTTYLHFSVIQIQVSSPKLFLSGRAARLVPFTTKLEPDQNQ